MVHKIITLIVLIYVFIMIKIVSDKIFDRLQEEVDRLDFLCYKYEELIEKEKDLKERLENLKNKNKE